MPELQYAIDSQGKMVHIDTVPNGLACHCTCPGCGAPLVAKNNGETMTPHFAHHQGDTCAGAHESELHILAKEIIAKEKCVMLPAYGNVFNGGMQQFTEIEVERRNDLATLQPDLCGIATSKDGRQSRLWIEIKVTHPIGPEKRALIMQHDISCIEIDMSQFMDKEADRDDITAFLTRSKEGREWTHNGVLERRQQELAEEKRVYAQRHNTATILQNPTPDSQQATFKDYQNSHPDECVVNGSTCLTCKHHTTRIAIMEEMQRRHLPAWLKEPLSSSLTYWTREHIGTTVSHNRCYKIDLPNYMQLLPTESPNIFGKEVSQREIRQNNLIIPFLIDTVPNIIQINGLTCKHKTFAFPTTSNKFYIACNMPNVVNKHRKRK